MSFEQKVRDRLEDVLSGEKQPDEIMGATSVRCAMGLVLGSLEGVRTLSEQDAWDYLDPGNVETVHRLRHEYEARTSGWRQA